HLCRKAAREDARSHRLARVETCILAHVAKIGHHEAHTRRAQFTQGVGQENQGQVACIRLHHVCEDHAVAAGRIIKHTQVTLAVGELPPIQLAQGGVETRLQRSCQGVCVEHIKQRCFRLHHCPLPQYGTCRYWLRSTAARSRVH